jgi:hypothetical protein
VILIVVGQCLLASVTLYAGSSERRYERIFGEWTRKRYQRGWGSGGKPRYSLDTYMRWSRRGTLVVGMLSLLTAVATANLVF